MLTARYVWCTYQNVFITGGSQGLGLALAKQLVAQGANVVLCSRSEAKLVRAVQEVEPYRQSSAQTIQYVAADVSSFAGAAQGLAKCPWVPCTVFCCAGGAQPGLFLEQTESDFEAAMKTDYWTALSTAHAAANAMRAQQIPGRIVFVSSVVGLMGLVGYAQYAPMKFAIRGRFLHLPGLAECLRSEFALYDITIQAYFPATILSPGYDEEQKTKPLVTKKIEEGDDAKTPEQCADCLLKGVAAGSFSITDGIVGTLLRVSSGGSAPGGRLWLDLPLMLPARLALLAWRRFVADRTVAHFRQAS